MSVWHGINCPFCGQLHAGLPCPSVKGSREVWYPVHHYHGGGEWENAHTAPIGLVTDEQAEILSLRAKLQAAEEALAADDQASHTIEWKSRAEAAEARIAELEARETRLREALGHYARHHWQCNAFNPSQRDREEGRDKCDCNGKTAIEALEVKP